jgi:formyltetrahydrofolate synthetase
MVEIYSADTTTDAHLVKSLLEQHGVDAFVSGHYLQGAFGELPVMNIIQVMVASQDEKQARQILHDYDNGKFAIDETGDH